jgi:hypothetical protein
VSREISITLGIDFGTRFTKVCARSEEVGASIVDLANNGLDGALIPSIVVLDDAGNLSVPAPGTASAQSNRIAYLKMALAERGQLDVDIESDLMAHASEDIARPLSAFFLANVIQRAKKRIISAWNDHIGEREVIWSANVGLPVEYVDSDVAPKFQEVLAVAWEWAEGKIPTGDIPDIEEAYYQASAQKDAKLSYCQTYPEIAAAVLSFATNRSSKPGIFVYFDIGGGTIDGVAFNLIRSAGEIRINFYSGHVASLGADWIAEEACRRQRKAGCVNCDVQLVKRILLTGDSKQVDAAFASYSKKTSKLVGEVIYEGKQKDGRNWRSLQFQATSAHRTLRRHSDDTNVWPLRVFLGGGASFAPFFQKAIISTYMRHNLGAFGVPPFELIEVPAPPDLQMQSVDPNEYHRFLIAYGLSVPFGEGPDIKLPSQFNVTVPTRSNRTIVIPDYGDHKDIFD